MPMKPKYHRHTLPRSTASKERGRFYSTVRWKRLRAVILKRDVECQICHQRPAVHVDHKDNNYRNNDLANLWGLCRQCHCRKTLADMRGQPASESKPVRQFPEDYRFV
jgi:5-methylcytosine-specific restriction enzyme A